MPTEKEFGQKIDRDVNDWIKLSRQMDRQEALLHKSATENWKPKDFPGDLEQFRQAVSQAYLQNYNTRYGEGKDTARDYRERNVGYALELARQFVGLRPNDPTFVYQGDPVGMERWKAQNPIMAEQVANEKANPEIPITKFMPMDIEPSTRLPEYLPRRK